MITFLQFCQSLGIILPQDIPSDKWVSANTVDEPRKKKASVKISRDGKAGFAIDWRTMTECAVWRADVGTLPKERSAQDNAELSARLALREKEERAGIARARALYGGAQPIVKTHPYLEKKKLDMNGCRGLRVDKDGWMLIPMLRDGLITSLQRISPDGEKKFVLGAPVKWTQHRIARPGAVMTAVVEGLATGLTVFAALGVADVIVTFSASNMVAVAERESWIGMTVIAADNDHWTREIHGKNPGEDAAKKAAKSIGCDYVIPHCDGTDWNDLFCERLAKLEANKREFDSPHALRSAALAPIKLALMNAAKRVERK